MKESSLCRLKAAAAPARCPHPFASIVWDAALSSLLLAGFVLFAASCCGSGGTVWPVLCLCAVLPAGMLLSERRTKTRPAFYVLPVLCAAALSFFWRSVGNGFLLFCNRLLDAVGSSSGRIMPQMTLWQEESACDIALWLWLMTAVLSIPTVWCVKRGSPVVPSLLVLTMGGFGCFTGKMPAAGILLAMLPLAALWLRFLSRRRTNGQGSPARHFAVNAAVLLLGGLVCIASALSGMLPDFAAARDAVTDTVSRLCYGESVLPEGDFTRLSGFSPSGEAQLEVVMSEPDSYYLRGFVGSEYTGSGWESPGPAGLYQRASLFYWLHQDGFYGQTQLAGLTQLVDPSQQLAVLTVRNIGASTRYLYAPYEVVSAEGGAIPDVGIGDLRLLSTGLTGTRTYRLTVLPNQVRRYPSLAAAFYEKEGQENPSLSIYRNDEAHYNEYVYANNLTLPENIRVLLTNLLGEYDKGGQRHLSYTEAKQNILCFLTSNMTYSPQATPADSQKDFAETFLQETRSGFSVHFATAAALMFRYYGIPARYVEGYLITPEDVDGVLSHSAVVVTDENAHAWVEIYQDGVGWIPFEATPSYFGVMEQAEGLTGVPTEGNGSGQSPEDGESLLQEDPGWQGTEEMQQTALGQIGWGLLILLAAAVLTGAVLLARLLLGRRKRLHEQIRSFDCDDARMAVLSLFDYSTGLLLRFGVLPGPNAVYDGAGWVKSRFGEEYARQYVAAFVVFEKARFSTHTLNSQELEAVRLLKRQTVCLCRRERSRLQQLADRYFWYLYR